MNPQNDGVFYKFGVLIFRARALGGGVCWTSFSAAKVGGETSGKAIKEAKEAKEEVKSYGFAEMALKDLKMAFHGLKVIGRCRFRCRKYYLLCVGAIPDDVWVVIVGITWYNYGW